MAKSCKGLAMELVKCLAETDCVKVQKRTYKECVISGRDPTSDMPQNDPGHHLVFGGKAVANTQTSGGNKVEGPVAKPNP